METTLTASTRTQPNGKSGARKIRAAGKVPAVIYGSTRTGAQSIEVDPHLLNEIFRKSNNRNTVIQLAVDGKSLNVFVREVQRHPLTRVIEHVDFFEVESGLKIVVDVPLTTSGKAKGLSLGGRVTIMRRTVKVRCEWDKIPATLDIDVTPMDVGEFIRVSEIPAPEGVEILAEPDYQAVLIAGKIRDREDAAAPAADAKPAAGKGKAAPAKAAAPAAKAPAKK